MEANQRSATPAQCYHCGRRRCCSSHSNRTKPPSSDILTTSVGNPKPDQGQWRFPGRLGQPDSSVSHESPRVLSSASARLLQTQLEEELGAAYVTLRRRKRSSAQTILRVVGRTETLLLHSPPRLKRCARRRSSTRRRRLTFDQPGRRV